MNSNMLLSKNISIYAFAHAFAIGQTVGIIGSPFEWEVTNIRARLLRPLPPGGIRTSDFYVEYSCKKINILPEEEWFAEAMLLSLPEEDEYTIAYVAGCSSA